MTSHSAARTLAALDSCKAAFGGDIARRKRSLLRELAAAPLASAEQVRRLHDVLCFLRAYPDDAAVLRRVERMLAGFARRADLIRFRDELALSGIAGTRHWFPYFWPTARWLAARWPRLLRFDRDDAEAGANLARALPLLVGAAEAHALRERKLGGYAAIDRVRGAATDAAYLVHRVQALPGDDFTREAFYDAINPSCELLPGRSAAGPTPSRTIDRLPFAPSAYQRQALRRVRPDLAGEMRQPPSAWHACGAREGARLVELARRALAVRQRDLDAFAYGNPRDTWLVDDGDGLAFALVGMIPARRAPFATVYGTLTLRNGVPIGYGQVDLVGRACALSFNTFEEFRGGESAHVLARELAALHALFGIASVSVDPYQLGHGNDEGLDSGAWWFYFKLGFRPRAAAARALARRELDRQKRNPAHRSSRRTLQQLAQAHLHLDLDPHKPLPLPALSGIGLRIADALAAWGTDRERALDDFEAQAARRCGLALRSLHPPQRRIWRQWAPWLATLRGLARWPTADRRALVDVIRAKAAVREREYVLRVAAHTRLCRALFDGPAGD